MTAPTAAVLPEGRRYREGFIAEAEEAILLHCIARLPLKAARFMVYTVKRRIVSFGTDYDHDRKQLLGGEPVPCG